jgi:hypothetical protein
MIPLESVSDVQLPRHPGRMALLPQYGGSTYAAPGKESIYQEFFSGRCDTPNQDQGQERRMTARRHDATVQWEP